MANNLYPLTYKPGIKRDGSIFQSDYCTSGQWVRFQRGCIRKIGGMRGRLHRGGAAVNQLETTSIFVIPNVNNDFIVYTFASFTGITLRITKTIFTQDMTISNNIDLSPNNINLIRSIFQQELIIQNNTKYLVCLFGSYTADNINNNNPCNIYYSNITADQAFLPLANPPVLTGLSGLLYVTNYLFVYGSNGLVQWSRANNPLDFSNPLTRQITISNDKVICAKSIRGGINNPAILFWTMSSVVRCINNPGLNTPPDTLAFQVDVISKSSSILSSRCVVEYDGLFFWPGNNRFFHYNGLVQELPNTMSLNYFFNNIDMRYRQNVFGVKNTQYGEIWWFYPELPTTPGRLALPEGLNTRALIYNVRENSWYDTAISRIHGVYSDDFGFMLTFGKSLPRATDVTFIGNFLYKHEDSNGPAGTHANEVTFTGFAGNEVSINPIVSNFTAPVISWAAFNAMKQFTGINRWVHLITIEPDFTLMPSVLNGGGPSDMTVVINTRQYAHDFPLSSPPYTILGPLSNVQDPALGKVDISYQGRYITLTFSTTRNFEMGQVILQLGIGDGQ